MEPIKEKHLLPERPQMVLVKKTQKETAQHTTFFFDFNCQAKGKKARLPRPGQFLMVWIPGIDEKPISLSKISEKECAITVQCKGIWSEKICSFGIGGKLWIRGPYGKGFETKGVKKAIVVAGGCGAAPLRPLVEELLAKKIKTRMVLGAQTGSALLFREEFGKKLGKDLYITTDDCSFGRKGFTTEVLKELLSNAKEKPDCVYSCGPEPMMRAVFELCESKGAKCQLSLERYCRCGIGICGQCIINEFMVCKDGPVFGSEQLRKMSEFGKIARLKSGKEVSLKEFASWRQC